MRIAGVIMGGVRRWAIIPILSLLMAALAAPIMPSASASIAAGPVRMNYACALGHNGLSGYAAIPAECDIQVTRVKPPVAVDDTAITGKYSAVNINVLANDTGPAGLPLTVAAVNTTGTEGTVSINGNGTIHYNPHGQFAGLTAGQTATDTFTYTVTDGTQTSNSATVTVTIVGCDDPPVLSNIETTPLIYQWIGLPETVTTTLAVSDDDDTTMSGATISITSGYDPVHERLSLPELYEGIVGRWDSATGVMTLAGAGSRAEYQAALQSVEFSGDESAGTVRRVSFTVTDSLGATSATATRAIDFTAATPPPTVVNQSYTTAGNTPLGVGTTPSGPAVTVSGSLLKGDRDADPTADLVVTAITTPAHGTLSRGDSSGSFIYVPNPGYSGTDSFQVTITAFGANSGPFPSSTETVSIVVGRVVWYVNDSDAAAGNGEADAPFNTLAAATAAAGRSSTIFLYQGNASYAGGVTMHPGEDLWGQPHGLTVGGHSLVPAGGSPPVITNGGGDGIDLAEGADVEGVNVSGPSGSGIAAADVNDATVGVTTAVAVNGAGGDGIFIYGGDGDLNFGRTTVAGSAGDALAADGRGGGTVTFGGRIAGTGRGVSLTNNAGATIAFTGTLTLSTGPNPAFTATGGGTITATRTGSTLATTTGTALTVQHTTIGSAGLKFQSVSSSGPADGIDLAGTGPAGGLAVTGSGTAGSGGTIQHSTGDGIELSSTYAPSFTDMVIKNNGGDGLNVDADGTTNATVSVTGSTFTGTRAGFGFVNTALAATGSDSVTFTGNTITGDPAATVTVPAWGTTFTGGVVVTEDGSQTVCTAITGNSISGAGLGISLALKDASTIELPGYTGGPQDLDAVESFLEGRNSAQLAVVALTGSGRFTGGSSC